MQYYDFKTQIKSIMKNLKIFFQAVFTQSLIIFTFFKFLSFGFLRLKVFTHLARLK